MIAQMAGRQAKEGISSLVFFIALLSINLAILRLDAGELFLEASYRFFNQDQATPLQQGVLALARAFDLDVAPVVGYPGWQPDFDSALLARGIALHQRLFGHAPAVKAIHAGLECALIGDKYEGMDMISFGPTMEDPQSPSERLFIPSIARVWEFMVALLASYKE